MPASSRNYSIVEPHPNAVPTSYIPTGRGGAGNYVRTPTNLTKGASAQGPPSRISVSTASSTTSSRSAAFHSGRGGAGNTHPATERAIFSFDEELERQLSQERHAAPVYHVGRGGAGNVTTSAYPKTSRAANAAARKASSGSDSGSEKSVGSVESGADVATRAMKGALRRVFH
jgi:hypothetical protein